MRNTTYQVPNSENGYMTYKAENKNIAAASHALLPEIAAASHALLLPPVCAVVVAVHRGGATFSAGRGWVARTAAPAGDGWGDRRSGVGRG
ncbi:hypothetical protein KY284_026531 [Solanum tuberosum]|nr:hypothetical protein KY284_026531 [Solanum tuberosum]